MCKTDPDGKTWEVVATGFRNQYDIDFNGDGELFTYDADMEWDLNTPWYRATRVNHVISGAEFEKVKSVEPSPVSMMPPGLLVTLEDTDVLDLIAYVLSGGDPEHAMYAK